MHGNLQTADVPLPGGVFGWDHLDAGTRSCGKFHSIETASGQTIEIPYLVARGRHPGRRLWVNAAVHGDEVNGALAAIEFARALDPTEMSGSVIVTPIANILAFDQRRKSATIDELDMDQSFPGREEGLPTQRVAACLFRRVAPGTEVVVNLHTLGTPFDSTPYAVYKVHPQAAVAETELLSMIACFAPSFACRMPVGTAAEGELPGNIEGALDYQCLAAGKAAFMIELGGGGRCEPEHIEVGARGLRRLCQHIGILPGPPDATPPTFPLVTKRRHVMAEKGGFFLAKAIPGTVLARGEPLGVIKNVFGVVVEEVLFEQDILVIATRRDPVVHAGDRVGFVGLEWDVN